MKAAISDFGSQSHAPLDKPLSSGGWAPAFSTDHGGEPQSLHTFHLSARGRVIPHADAAASFRNRRRMRMLWFATYETAAIIAMVVSTVVGISSRFADPSLTPLFCILPIAAATIAAVLPIVYFGDPKFRNGRRRRRTR